MEFLQEQEILKTLYGELPDKNNLLCWKNLDGAGTQTTGWPVTQNSFFQILNPIFMGKITKSAILHEFSSTFFLALNDDQTTGIKVASISLIQLYSRRN